MLNDDTNLVMGDNVFWNDSIDFLIAYHGKAITLMLPGSLPGS